MQQAYNSASHVLVACRLHYLSSTVIGEVLNISYSKGMPDLYGVHPYVVISDSSIELEYRYRFTRHSNEEQPIHI